MTTDLFITCACGSRIPVSQGQAASVVSCECGRECAVPGLSELRRQSGQDAYTTNAVESVHKAIGEGDLPGPNCIQCQATPDYLIRCRVVCERSFAKNSTSEDEAHFGAFFLGIFGRLFSPLWIKTREQVSVTHGRDTVVEPSFRLCRSCQASAGNLRRKRTLRRLLRLVPQYAQLLHEYPQAKLLFLEARESPVTNADES